MKEVTDKNFGVLIAFLLPGFILLWSLSFSWPEIGFWFKSTDSDSPTVGNFLYATLASLAIGLLISAIRWFFVDHLLSFCGGQVNALSGLRRPDLDLSSLSNKDVLAAYNGAVENHYRYYQYYSNTLVAEIIGFGSYAYARSALFSRLSILVGFISLILLFASGDSLSKYYRAASQILNTSAKGEANDKRLGPSDANEEINGQEDGEENFKKGGGQEGGGQEVGGQERGGQEGGGQEVGGQERGDQEGGGQEVGGQEDPMRNGPARIDIA
jgi:hypothetical protein